MHDDPYNLHPTASNRIRAVLIWILLVVSAMPMAGWLCSLVFSDATTLLQFVAFVPRWIWALVAAIPLVPVIILVGPRLRFRPAAAAGSATRPSAIPVRTARVFVAAMCLITLQVLLVDLRLTNMFRSQPAGPSLAIGQWNLSMGDTEPWTGSLPKTLGPAGSGTLPQVFLLTTNQRITPFNQMVATLQEDGKPWKAHRKKIFTIITHLPVKSARELALPRTAPLPGTVSRRQRWEDLYNNMADKVGINRRVFTGVTEADMMEIVLDATSVIGREIVIWFIDLPSDPFLSRDEVAESIRTWLLAEQSRPRSDDSPEPLRQPDLVVGDFNIPRNCRSIDTILKAAGRPMTHGFDQAGWGIAATWPLGHPILHIDQAFTAPTLEITSYNLRRTPVSDHYAQVFELVAADKGK